MSLFVDIEKDLGSFHLKVSLETDGGITGLLGASGCGKSMTLKCIAGICRPDRGRIVLNGKTLFDSEQKIDLPPQKRRVGYLFQQYALFPNMTVEQNIAAGVRDKKQSKTIVADMIRRMRLEGHEKLRPHQLSGGQQQRVALARILVNEPEVLLLDEPLSALDSHLRFQMEEEVRGIIRSFGKSMVLVSHNQEEVYRLSDRVAVMANGQVECIGDKETVFAQPKTKNAAILTGCRNISCVRHLGENRVFAEDWGIELTVPQPDCDYVGIRAQDIQTAGVQNKLVCRVMEQIENPFSVTVMLWPCEQGKTPIVWELDKNEWNKLRAQQVEIYLPGAQIQCLKEL